MCRTFLDSIRSTNIGLLVSTTYFYHCLICLKFGAEILKRNIPTVRCLLMTQILACALFAYFQNKLNVSEMIERTA